MWRQCLRLPFLRYCYPKVGPYRHSPRGVQGWKRLMFTWKWVVMLMCVPVCVFISFYKQSPTYFSNDFYAVAVVRTAYQCTKKHFLLDFFKETLRSLSRHFFSKCNFMNFCLEMWNNMSFWQKNKCQIHSTLKDFSNTIFTWFYLTKNSLR